MNGIVLERVRERDQKPVGVIGAGPAGLSCALALARKGKACEIFESLPVPGGMCRSFELWGARVDLGPHRFFSKDQRVNAFWLEQLGPDYVLVKRLTRIFYQRKFFAYPLKPFEALGKLGPLESLHCALSYLGARLQPEAEDKSFEQWVSRRFGKRLYEIFFKAYSEKLWGISCSELDASFAAQRIKGLNLAEALKNALWPNKRGVSKHKTLVEQFAYPALGAGQPYERMAQEFERLGGKIHYESEVLGIEAENGRVTGLKLADGRFDCAEVVSSMPLTEAVGKCPAFGPQSRALCKSLRYRNTILIYLKLNKENVFADNWIYVHDPALGTGRICNFRNWSPAMRGEAGTSIVALEFWANDNDPLWQADDARLADQARRELCATGLAREDEIADAFVLRLERSYPIYDLGFQERLAPIQAEADAVSGLTLIGRNGAFKYNNQDHSILMGLLAAENIARNAGHNLWKLNADYDYQEGAEALDAGGQKPAGKRGGRR